MSTKHKCEKVKFNGADYLWIADSLASKEQFLTGEVSYAWVDEEGSVWRYGQRIGNKSQIEFTGEFEEFEMTDEQIDDALPRVIAESLLAIFSDPPEAQKFRSERN